VNNFPVSKIPIKGYIKFQIEQYSIHCFPNTYIGNEKTAPAPEPGSRPKIKE